ncbi:MAG: response regulator [Candidatus Pacebacteria bacterium]|nr:response regulator [Candidatus Paceibacterota bacterium]
MQKKLLIVEDEPLLKNMYVDRLSRLDVEILSASTPKEGFAIAKKEKPDLILLDILLGDENGIELMEKVREEDEIKNTKILVFSNFDEPRTKKKIMGLGAIDYLLKTNYTPNQITKIIANFLKK